MFYHFRRGRGKVNKSEIKDYVIFNPLYSDVYKIELIKAKSFSVVSRFIKPTGVSCKCVIEPYLPILLL